MVLICSRFLPSVEMTLLAVFQRSQEGEMMNEERDVHKNINKH